MSGDGPTARLLFDVAECGSVFSTRGRARAARQALLARLHGQEVVELDFGGVRSFSYSFADEFLGKLLTDLDDHVALVRVLRVPPELRASLAATAQRRAATDRLEFG